MVQIENLNFGYIQTSPLFSNFCWNVEKGESWSVLGSSGSGKTTLLHLLAGLKKAHSGSIRINDEPLERPRPETGLILQNHGLLPWATVEKNIELGFKFRRFYGPDGKHCPRGFISDKTKENQQVLLWIEKMGLQELGKRYPHELSGGQQQRTAIARTLILKPDLLLMDEPFSSVDSPTRSSLQKLVIGLEKDSLYSRVLVTHSIEEALIMSRRILILRDKGREPVIMDNRKAWESRVIDKTLYDEILTILGDDFAK